MDSNTFKSQYLKLRIESIGIEIKNRIKRIQDTKMLIENNMLKISEKGQNIGSDSYKVLSDYMEENRELLSLNREALDIQKRLIKEYHASVKQSIEEELNREDSNEIKSDIEKIVSVIKNNLIDSERPLKDIKVTVINDKDFGRVFELTVDGRFPFDEKHPFYSDSAFLKKLLVYFEENEAYEQCALVKKRFDELNK